MRLADGPGFTAAKVLSPGERESSTGRDDHFFLPSTRDTSRESAVQLSAPGRTLSAAGRRVRTGRTAAVCDIMDTLELLLLSVGRLSEGWESQRCCLGWFFFGLIVAADGESIHQSSAALHFSVPFRWELYPERSRLNRTLMQRRKFAHSGTNKRLSFLILAYPPPASELALQPDRPRRTWRSTNAAEVAGDGEDDGQQHPQGGGAKAGPRDGPPGLDRHGTAAVARSEANTIGEGLHSTGVGTLEKHGENNSTKVSGSEWKAYFLNL